MNILFVLRIDAHCKPGGDLVQAKAYKDVLQNDLDCHISFAHELSRAQLLSVEWDVVQLFNISRLYEHLLIMDKVKYHRILLTPIMQPGFVFNKYVFLKSFIRCLLFVEILKPLGKDYIKLFLRKISGFVFLSIAERDAFFNTYPYLSSYSYAIYNNAISNGFTDVNKRLFDYIIVGRIEPKKGVLRAITSIQQVQTQATICCVGALNWYHPIYCLIFLTYVLRGGVLFLGKRSPEFISALMQQSSVLMNMSELEVSPLVDLEALACGCKVMSTIYSYTHLNEADNYIIVDVKNKSCILSALQKLDFTKVTTQAKILPETWERNSKNYIKLISLFRNN